MKYIILIATLFFSSTFVLACDEGDNYSNLECYQKEIASNEANLKNLTAKFNSQQDESGKKLFRFTDVNWRKYVKSQCEDLNGYLTRESLGVGAALIETSCKAELLKQRVELVTDLIDWNE